VPGKKEHGFLSGARRLFAVKDILREINDAEFSL
jgi:hypothetical protein